MPSLGSSALRKADTCRAYVMQEGDGPAAALSPELPHHLFLKAFQTQAAVNYQHQREERETGDLHSIDLHSAYTVGPFPHASFW